MTDTPNSGTVSVSRELLKQWLDDIGESRHVTQYSAEKREQLRAILAQPAEQQVASLAVPDECPHMIVFDDTEREPMTFAGLGARVAALKTFEQISGSWNAHLFVRIARNSRDDRYPCASFVTAAQAVKLPDVDQLSNIIQQVDGNHSLGAGALAEKILEAVARLNGIKP